MGRPWDMEKCSRQLNLDVYLSLLTLHHKFVEMFASFLLCYLSGMIDTTITNFGTPQGPAYAGVINIFLLTLFIIAIAPGSGGQL